MPNHEGSLSRALPDPSEIARRIISVTQDPYVKLDVDLSPETKQETYFGLVDDRTAGSAAVILAFSSTRTTIKDGQETPDWSSESPLRMGHYDPARQEWMLYPEYVLPHERGVLGDVFEELASISHPMLVAESESDTPMPFVDMRHPITVQARSGMAEILASTGIARRLVEDNPRDRDGNMRQIDESTTYTLALTPKINGPGVGNSPAATPQERLDPGQYGITFDQTLSVAYRGLLLRQGHRMWRSDQAINIADRSEDDDSIWLPRLDVITVDEARLLGNVPQILLGYRQYSPDFSPVECAIVRHYDH